MEDLVEDLAEPDQEGIARGVGPVQKGLELHDGPGEKGLVKLPEAFWNRQRTHHRDQHEAGRGGERQPAGG